MAESSIDHPREDQCRDPDMPESQEIAQLLSDPVSASGCITGPRLSWGGINLLIAVSLSLVIGLTSKEREAFYLGYRGWFISTQND